MPNFSIFESFELKIIVVYVKLKFNSIFYLANLSPGDSRQIIYEVQFTHSKNGNENFLPGKTFVGMKRIHFSVGRDPSTKRQFRNVVHHYVSPTKATKGFHTG